VAKLKYLFNCKLFNMRHSYILFATLITNKKSVDATRTFGMLNKLLKSCQYQEPRGVFLPFAHADHNDYDNLPINSYEMKTFSIFNSKKLAVVYLFIKELTFIFASTWTINTEAPGTNNLSPGMFDFFYLSLNLGIFTTWEEQYSYTWLILHFHLGILTGNRLYS